MEKGPVKNHNGQKNAARISLAEFLIFKSFSNICAYQGLTTSSHPKYVAAHQTFPNASRIPADRSPYGLSFGASIEVASAFNALA
jgi:hypothetical protein